MIRKIWSAAFLVAFLMALNTFGQDVLQIVPFDGSDATYVNAQIVADTIATNGLLPTRVYELQRDAYYLANAIFTVPNGKTLRLRAADGTGKKPIIYLWESGTGSNPTRPPGNFVVLNGGNLEMKNICVAGFYEPEESRVEGTQGGLINTTAAGATIILDGVILTNINGQHVRTGQNTVKVQITNSIFANMGCLSTSNLGAGKGIDLREAACDTFILVNNTFVNYQDRAIRHYNFANPATGTGVIKYGRIDHNTFINGMGFHGLFSLGNVGDQILIENNLFVDGFALGEDSTDATRAAEWANTGEFYPNGRNRITWIFTAPNDVTQWSIKNNYYSQSDAGKQFLADFNFPVGSQLSWHINSKLGADSVNAFKNVDVILPNIPNLMTNMMRWYEDPAGGNKLKDQTNYVRARDDYDRRRIEYYRDTLNAAYDVSSALYTGGVNGFPVGDLNWFPDKKAAWENPIGTVTVTSPNGGESWTSGTTNNITWTSTGNISTIDIQYSKDNGTNWTTIASNLSNSGLYEWPIPAGLSSVQSRIQVVAYFETQQTSDASDNVFTVHVPAVLEDVVHIVPFDGSDATYVNAQIVADTVATNGLLPTRVYELQRDAYYLANAIFTVPNGKTLRLRAADGTGKKPIIYLWESGTGSNPTRPPGNFVVLNGGNLEMKNICVAGFYEPEESRVEGTQGGLINTTAAGATIILDGVILTNINGQHVRTGQNTVKVQITNSIFANMGCLSTSNLGAGKGIDLREAACDTFILVNNTFVNYQDRAIRHYNFANPATGTGVIKYGRIDHNTFINGMGFHGLFSLGNVGDQILIENNLFVDGFALGEDSTDATRAAEWANTGEFYPNGRNRITWIFTAPNDVTQWSIKNNYYSQSDAGKQFLADFNFPVGSQLSWHINSKLGADSVNAFKNVDVILPNIPNLMTNMMRWYEDPAGGNKLKDQTNYVRARDDYDRRRIEYYRDTLNAAYDASSVLYTGAAGYPAGDLNWFPDKKAAWEINPTAVDEENISKVEGYTLKQNYPNPFNPSTIINYELPSTGLISIKVFDVIGQEVTTLVNEIKPAGKYSVKFDASKINSGVYFYKLVANNVSITRKMVLIK